jgi:hypothetical protein
MRLRPKLFRELQPGVRVVSHDFDMGDWEPESKVEVGKDGRHTLYFWVMPTGVGGTWRGEAHSLRLRQQLQKINGSIIDERRQEVPISEAKLVGDQLTFGALTTSGRIKDDRIEGSVRTEGAASNDKREWKVARQPYEIAGTWRWTVPRQETPIPGGLRIRREKNHFAATYLAGNEEVPLPTGGDERNYFIAQGASVMFEVSLKNGTSFKYNGLVDGDRITGTVSTGFSSLAREWSAQRTDK